MKTNNRAAFQASPPFHRMPDVEEQLRRRGIEPMTGTPREFAAFLRSDIRILNPAGLVPVLVDAGQVLTRTKGVSSL